MSDEKAHKLLFKSVAGTVYQINTPDDISQDKDILLTLGAHIPNFEVLNNGDQSPDIVFSYHRDHFNACSFGHKEITYSTSHIEKFPVDLYHLIYGAIRKDLIHRFNYYAVHAACVEAKDGYKLLVGHSGAGKTTLAQNIIDRGDHDITTRHFFSGNKTVLEISEHRIIANAGTKTMTALDEHHRRYAYRLLETAYSPKPCVNIGSIDIIRINDGVQSCETLTRDSALHTLYPYILDAVNADIIVHGDHLFDGAVPPLAKRQLIQNLSTVLNKIPVRKISGSMSYLETMTL